MAAAGAAVTAWGIGNVIIAAIPMSGLAIAFHRLWMGAVLYVGLLRLLRGRWLRTESFRHGAAGGAVFGCNIATFFLAVRTTSVANAVTISALQPIVILGVAAVMFGERIRWRHVMATGVAVSGVALVTFGAGDTGASSRSGDLWAVAALLTWSLYFIASKSARRHLETLEYMAVINLVAWLVVAPLALLTGALTRTDGQLDAGRSLAILCVVLIPGSGHLLINWAHGHTTLMLTSLITLAMPVISTVTAAVFLDQPVNGVQALGIGVVLAALAAVIVGDARAGRPEPAGPLEVTEPGS